MSADLIFARGLNRRAVLRLALLGSVGSLLAACQPAAPPPAAPATQPPAAPKPTAAPAAAAQPPAAAGAQPTAAPPAAVKPTTPPVAAANPPKSGGTLRVGQIPDILNLEPQSNQKGTSPNVWLAYDRLTDYDLSVKPQPMLAESWELSADAKQIKVNLRKGVQFHTGRELTSDDVKYSVIRARDPKLATGVILQQAQWFSTIETPDKYTVVLKSDESRPLVFDFFQELNIVDKVTLDGPDAKTKSVGTGPFKFVEWRQGDRLTFVKNENYWQSGRPYLNEVRVQIIGDAPALVVQLEAGSLDVVRDPNLEDFVRLKSNAKFQAMIHPAGGAAYLIGANVLHPPLADKRVRQALNYAIDRKRFVETALNGVGQPVDLPWSEGSPAYETAKMTRFGFDLDRARSLLSQAGASNLTLDILPNAAQPSALPFSEIYQADLAKIGVKLNIRQLDPAAWRDEVINRKYNGFWYSAHSTGLQVSPGTVFNSAPLRPETNNQGYDNPEYTRLVTAANSEPDPAKLKQIYSQLNDILLEESFAMYLSTAPTIQIARAGVNDFTPNMWGTWSLTNTWIA